MDHELLACEWTHRASLWNSQPSQFISLSRISLAHTHTHTVLYRWQITNPGSECNQLLLKQSLLGYFLLSRKSVFHRPAIWFLKHTQCISKEKERAGRNIVRCFLSVRDFSVCDQFVWQTLSACNWASCRETDCSSLSQPHRRVRTTWTTRREGDKVWQKSCDLDQSY